MKKRLFKILTLLLALCLGLMGSGCDACGSSDTLLFNSNFLGSSSSADAPINYTEKLVFDVKYEKQYERISANTEFYEKGIQYDFNGTYEMEFKSISSLPEEIESDIETQGQTYYSLRTKLSLNAWYKIDGTYAEGGVEKQGGPNNELGREYLDTIESIVYFLPAGLSYAPIYAKTINNCSYLNVGGGKYEVAIMDYSTQTTYQKDSYAFKLSTKDENLDNACKYNFKSVIDNTQLLFVLRNYDLKENATKELPTVSTAYTLPQTLNVMNAKNSSLNMKIKINGEEDAYKNNPIPVSNLRFNRKDGLNTGSWQYATIQKNTIEDLNAKSLLLKYAAPLTSNGNYLIMGALVYQLTEVSYSN